MKKIRFENQEQGQVVSLVLSPNIIKMIDDIIKMTNLNRSEFIRQCIVARIENPNLISIQIKKKLEEKEMTQN